MDNKHAMCALIIYVSCFNFHPMLVRTKDVKRMMDHLGRIKEWKDIQNWAKLSLERVNDKLPPILGEIPSVRQSEIMRSFALIQQIDKFFYAQ